MIYTSLDNFSAFVQVYFITQIKYLVNLMSRIGMAFSC